MCSKPCTRFTRPSPVAASIAHTIQIRMFSGINLPLGCANVTTQSFGSSEADQWEDFAILAWVTEVRFFSPKLKLLDDSNLLTRLARRTGYTNFEHKCGYHSANDSMLIPDLFSYGMHQSGINVPSWSPKTHTFPSVQSEYNTNLRQPMNPTRRECNHIKLNLMATSVSFAFIIAKLKVDAEMRSYGLWALRFPYETKLQKHHLDGAKSH